MFQVQTHETDFGEGLSLTMSPLSDLNMGLKVKEWVITSGNRKPERLGGTEISLSQNLSPEQAKVLRETLRPEGVPPPPSPWI